MEHLNAHPSSRAAIAGPGCTFEWNARLDGPQRRLAVRFALNMSARVRLTLTSALSDDGKVLFDAPRSAGSFAETWEMVNSRGQKLAPGMYLVALALDGEAVSEALVIRS